VGVRLSKQGARRGTGKAGILDHHTSRDTAQLGAKANFTQGQPYVIRDRWGSVLAERAETEALGIQKRSHVEAEIVPAYPYEGDLAHGR
jgi:hypothetical protein